MQRQGVGPPSPVLPPAKITQSVRGACLPLESQILQTQFFEAALKSSVLLHFPRNQ
jgi:hypothetical protein